MVSASDFPESPILQPLVAVCACASVCPSVFHIIYDTGTCSSLSAVCVRSTLLMWPLLHPPHNRIICNSSCLSILSNARAWGSKFEDNPISREIYIYISADSVRCSRRNAAKASFASQCVLCLRRRLSDAKNGGRKSICASYARGIDGIKCNIVRHFSIFYRYKKFKRFPFELICGHLRILWKF